MTNDTTSAATPPSARGLGAAVLRRGAIAAALVGGGIAIGAAGFATAQGAMGPGGWQHGWHHHGPKVGRIQGFVRNALDNVGATSEQESKVHDIIASAYQKLEPGEGQHEGMRKQILEILKAPSIDRAAVESLRAKQIAEMDAKSKVIVGAALDAAAQLTPEQRGKLAQTIEARMDAHRGWRRWGHERGPDHGGQDGGEHGPDRG